MEQMRDDYSVNEMAETLEISKSGFYAHLKKDQRPRRKQDRVLAGLIQESFRQSRRTYGSPRIRLDLQQAGHRCGKNRITRLMRQSGLRPRQKRRFCPRTTDSGHDHPIAQNWLQKVPTADRPGQIWQSDITYIPTGEGWLYLAFTLDACSRRCLAHQTRADLKAQLTIDTLTKAMASQRPALPGLIHHSDRGSQYAAELFRQRLRQWGVSASMSRAANPYDNALAESFVSTLKTECFDRRVPATRQQARLMIFDYIECFYNPRRRHSALGYQSPVQFENQLINTQGEGCSGGGNPGGETCPQSRSALAAGVVNHSQTSGSNRRKQPGQPENKLHIDKLNL